MHINRVREDVHDLYLKLRMLDRIIETEEFERAYEGAVDFRMLKDGIEELDVDIIKFFILLNRDPGELSIRELRKVARHYNVAFWSRLDREELIEETTNQGLNSRTREIARQIDVLSNSSKGPSQHADGRDALAGRATISRSIGIHIFSDAAATVECCRRRKSLSAGTHVGEHGDAGGDRAEGAEDTRDSPNGPQILLES